MLLRIFPTLWRIVCVFGYLFWAIIAGPVDAQQTTSLAINGFANNIALPTANRVPDTTVGDALRHLAFHAGTAFVGTVQNIEQPGPNHPSTVIITFQVTQPILGNAGSTYTLNEWSGLWTMGRQRYTLGQRALFFFHPANAAGLSSPVDGMDGILPLIPTSADAIPLLDVRRLTTRVQRRAGDPLPNADTAAITLADAGAILTHGSTALEPTLRALPAGVASQPTAVLSAGGSK